MSATAAARAASSAESPSAKFATKSAEASPNQPGTAEPDAAPATRLRSSSQATPKVEAAPKKPNRVPEPELGLGLPARKKLGQGASSADVPSARAPAAASQKEADSASDGEPAPKLRKPSTASDFHSRLTAFYRQYNPSKMGSVKSMLIRYQGREEVLFSNLVSKYGPEPSVDEDVTAAKVPTEAKRTTESPPAMPSGTQDGAKKTSWAW